MGRGAAIAGLVVLFAAATGWWLLRSQSMKETGAAVAVADVAVGQALYAEYCASCHGANLEGQPDWQSATAGGILPAPPHDETGHTWHHGDALLFDYIRLGGREALAQRGVDFDSGMPGFADRLNDRQIAAILAYIKSTWPEPIRALQAERTAAE